MENLKILTGYTNSENAHIVNDYPYGYKKTDKKYWIESNIKNGERVCTQTLNPKTNQWNNIKKSTYSTIRLLAIDPENNHTITIGLTNYSSVDEITEFENNYQEFLTDFQKEQIKRLKALNNAWKNIKVTIGENTGQPKQTIKDQVKIVNKVFQYEYKKLK